jgi:hypothetical protein
MIRWRDDPMAVFDSQRIVRHPGQRTASPPKVRGGAFQNGLCNGDARGNFIPELAFERRGCDPQEELQSLRGQKGRIHQNSRIEIRNARGMLCGIGFRISISQFRSLRGGGRNVGIET